MEEEKGVLIKEREEREKRRDSSIMGKGMMAQETRFGENCAGLCCVRTSSLSLSLSLRCALLCLVLFLCQCNYQKKYKYKIKKQIPPTQKVPTFRVAFVITPGLMTICKFVEQHLLI